MKFLTILPIIAMMIGCAANKTSQPEAITPRGKWTPAQAQAWSAKHPWLVGSNFIPSTAINPIEMWQADTWDPKTIDRELGWAQSLGFTSMRVFLHDIPWREDREGFFKRVDEYLAIAEKHHIGTMFVIFDGVWDPYPHGGTQRPPKPHVHNSGWVQSPGADILGNPSRHEELKPYVQDLIRRYRNDKRVQVWDIFNEPNNPVPQYADVELKNKAEMALLLLKKEYEWAREMNPSQPLTSGVWIGTWSDPAKLTDMERTQLEESDVISFHNYSKLGELKKCVASLLRYDRPIICTEYMARPMGSTFKPNLAYLKSQHVGAYNWGFVSGKTQTIFPWDSWTKQYGDEPPIWFHDIFRPNGTPYRQSEVNYIREVTGKK